MITHLSTFHRHEILGFIFLVLFFWLDLVCMFTIWNQTQNGMYVLFLAIPLLPIHIWAVRLVIKNIYAIQMESIYFIAILSVLSMYGAFLIVLTSLYFIFTLPIFVSLLLASIYFISWMIYFTQYDLRKYANKRWNPLKKNVVRDVLPLFLIGFPGFSYFGYKHIVVGHLYQNEIELGIFSALSVILIYVAVHYVHKLLYIKINVDHFQYREPLSKERKKMKAKGQKLIIK